MRILFPGTVALSAVIFLQAHAVEHREKVGPDGAGAAGPPATQRPFPPDSTIQRILDERVAEKRAFGIVVATRDASGKTHIYHAGSSGKESLALDGNTVFEIGSITKTFTAALLADMATKGEIKLDDPVAKYLPSTVKMPERGGKQITLTDLSTHSSGLPSSGSHPHPRDSSNPWADFTVDQMYHFLSGYKLPRDIGAKYEYSNLGVGLLGHVLALRAGKSWEEAVTERILKPLNMTDTKVTINADMRHRLALGHNKAGRAVSNWDIPTIPGMGALRSTANDMLKYLAANMESTSKPLGKTLAMTHVSRREAWGPETMIGLTWQIGNDRNKNVIRHSGGTGGYTGFIGFDPIKRVGVVILSNSSFQVYDIGFHLLDQSIPLEEDSPAIKSLRSMIVNRGFAHTMEVVDEEKKKDPKFQLAEADVNAWGYRLLEQEQRKEAVEVFKLNVSLYPKSANTYDSLAEAYEALGDKASAIKNFKRSLELNPKNTNAVEHLKKLEPDSAKG
jgi:CubicO group peptidase (beta-lactamase class C family)